MSDKVIKSKDDLPSKVEFKLINGQWKKVNQGKVEDGVKVVFKERAIPKK